MEKVVSKRMKTIRKCPACLGQNGSALYTNHMKFSEGINFPETYDIVCCDVCGMCYADTSATAEDYDEYYKRHNYYGAGWQFNSSSECDYTVIENSISRLGDKSIRIIDIGCGNGGLLEHLYQDGYRNIAGVDPSSESIEYLRSKGIEGHIGSIYDDPDTDMKKADVAVFTMVLEHLLEPDNAIRSICERYLSSDGYIVVSWPYFDDMIADCSPILNNFNHEHINYFSKLSADWLFGRCGLERCQHHVSLGLDINGFVQFSNVAVYKKSEVEPTSDCFQKDMYTSVGIKEYTDRMQKKEDETVRTIQQLVEVNSEVAIWGTGAYLMHMMAASELSKCRISHIVDGNPLKQGVRIYGYEVESPELIKSFEGIVLIASMLYGRDIEKQIRDMDNSVCEIILL